MRIPPVVVSLLLLTSTALSAQGLAYRVRMHMSMPGMPEANIPTPETTMFVEGANIRVDNSSRGMSMSLIMDGAKQRILYVNHNDKTYSEEKTPPAASQAARDTAAMRAMLPDVIPTSDKRTILGYPTERFVMVMRIPVASEPGMVMVSINESWIATDAKLREAFNSSIEAAERMFGAAAADMKSLMPPGAQGVPLETNIVMLKRAESDKVDALALLKEENPQGLMTRARMETLSVSVSDLPDSLFVVPATYRKSN